MHERGRETQASRTSAATTQRRRWSRRRRGPSAVLTAALLAVGLVAPVQAQQAIPRQVDPGQVQRRIPLPSERQEAPEPLQLPAPPEPGPPPEKLHFVLTAVVIEGNTVFDAAALASTYEDYLARDVDASAITAILQRITAQYRGRGYFLSRAVAPPQSVARGILRIKVIEGYVGRVTFRGATTDEGRLRPYLERVTASRPLRLDTLERAILLVNDVPGLHVASSLEPIAEQEGSYELVLDLGYRRLAGFASLDNRGPESLGPWEAQLSASAHSLLDSFDRAQLSFFTVPTEPRELLSTELFYQHPIGSDGAEAALSVARSDVRPEGSLAPLALKGTAMRYVARLVYPLIRSRGQSLWLGGLFDALDSRQHEAGVLLFDDRLRVLRVHANAVLLDGFGGANALYFEASQGLIVLGASRTNAANLSRSNGHPDFTKVAATATRQQALGGNWSAQIDLAGQKAAEPLLISEQFPLGGSRFGRAYDPAEVTGDDGLAGSLELRYGGPLQKAWLSSYQIYGFYDLGTVWNQAVSGGARRQSLASVGGGVRLTLTHDLAASIEIARPLTRTPAAEGDKGARIFGSISATF